MKKLNDKLKNTVRLKVTGMNIEKNLNALIKKDITFKHIEKEDYKTCTLEISKKDYKTVDKFLTDRNIKIMDKQYKGVYYFLHFFKLRYGLIIGAMISMLLIFVFNNLIFKIEIYGCENINKEEIYHVLSENNILSNGTLTKGIKEVEDILSDNFEAISLVSVIRKGSTLIINIKEKLINDEYENRDEFSPLVSQFDGMITKIELVQGTLKVNEGDLVQAGDILVEPYTINSEGEIMPISPKANIYADVYSVGKVIHYDITNQIVRTGNIYRERILYCFGVELFSKSGNPPFDMFEIEVQIVNISENNLLPIKYHDIVYYETEAVIIEQPFSVVESEKIAEARKLTMENLPEDCEIKEEYHTITQLFGKNEVKYIIVANRRIDVK